ncbi:hypothetical protein T492DRAFT_919914 [Pavlovales sp. CCMP2436]|nr:hypothetical protein T492DRAFT_919914 [Pavlovales sp. CCMP2436]
MFMWNPSSTLLSAATLIGLLVCSAAADSATCADNATTVPVIRLVSADPAAVDRALREVGFLAIVDHGVDEAVIEAAWRETAAWFARDAVEKARAPLLGPEYPYGYSPLHSESHPGSDDDERARQPGQGAPTLADEKEMFCIGPQKTNENGAPARLWPERSDALQAAWVAYFDEMVKLSERHHASALRAINYPALAHDLAPGQLRSSAHTDYGTNSSWGGEGGGGNRMCIFSRANEWGDVPEIDQSNYQNTKICLIRPAEGTPQKFAPILAGEHLMKKHEAATRGQTLNIYA